MAETVSSTTPIPPSTVGIIKKTTTSGSSSTSETTGSKKYITVTQLPKVTKREDTKSTTESKIKKTITVRDGVNKSREALTHEGSEREPVVFLSDSTGYIPVKALHPNVDYQQIGLEWRPENWERNYNRLYRFNNTKVQHIEAECQDDFMKIRIGFNGSFTGLLYSSGYAYDPDCMYINGSGRDYYEFYIQLNRCGTLGKNAIYNDNRKNPTKNFMWNTITVQYNPLIEEEFDEHFKVTCEYGYDFWKTVTFPFLEVEVATGNPVVFTLRPPECNMEIRNGYGLTGTRVGGPVRVGDPLTLIIYMRSHYDGFDVVVNECYAHNGGNKRIQLIDEYGCPVDDKLISRFRGSWTGGAIHETKVYAYMKTFRFTGSPALYIECDVRMCHGRCPSQPCHWRNIKSKRDLSNQNQTIELTKQDLEKQEQALSDNINLFQSLRVLQEGEDENYETNETETRSFETNETCIKTSLLSALIAGCCILLCVLCGLLLTACSKLRHRKKDDVYDAYINHKGQID